jgi:hypothetical protein
MDRRNQSVAVKDRERIPEVSDELVAYLDRLFPERTPSIDTAGRRIWMDAGNREVVRHLQTVNKRQNDAARKPVK